MNDDETVFANFIVALRDTLEAHSNAIQELYGNQKSMYEAMKRLSDRNDQLLQALTRDNNVRMQ